MKKSVLSLLVFASCALLASGPTLAAVLGGVPATSAFAAFVAALGLLFTVFVPLLLIGAFTARLGVTSPRAAGRVLLALLRRVGLVPVRARDPRPPKGTALLGLGLLGLASAQGTGAADGSGALLSGVLTLLGLAGSFALVTLSRLLTGKLGQVRNDTARQVSAMVMELVFAKVAELNAVAIEALKAAAVDGKLSPKEAQAAMKTAVDEVWFTLPGALKAALIKQFGGELGAKLQLIPMIEQAVRAMRSTQLRAVPGVYSVGSSEPLMHNVGPALPTARTLAAARSRIGLS